MVWAAGVWLLWAPRADAVPFQFVGPWTEKGISTCVADGGKAGRPTCDRGFVAGGAEVELKAFARADRGQPTLVIALESVARRFQVSDFVAMDLFLNLDAQLVVAPPGLPGEPSKHGFSSVRCVAFVRDPQGATREALYLSAFRGEDQQGPGITNLHDPPFPGQGPGARPRVRRTILLPPGAGNFEVEVAVSALAFGEPTTSPLLPITAADVRNEISGDPSIPDGETRKCEFEMVRTARALALFVDDVPVAVGTPLSAVMGGTGRVRQIGTPPVKPAGTPASVVVRNVGAGAITLNGLAVTDPAGVEHSATSVFFPVELDAGDAVEFVYPEDFAGAAVTLPGVYRISAPFNPIAQAVFARGEGELDFFPRAQAVLGLGELEATEPVVLAGSTAILTELDRVGDPDGNGREQVPAEIVQMDLSGTSPVWGPVTLRHRDPSAPPFRRSAGAIEELLDLFPGQLDVPPFVPAGAAQAEFDLFFELSTEGGGVVVEGALVGGDVVVPPPERVLHNRAAHPLSFEATITYKPAGRGEAYESQAMVPLVDELDQPAGAFVAGAALIPLPDGPCRVFFVDPRGAPPGPLAEAESGAADADLLAALGTTLAADGEGDCDVDATDLWRLADRLAGAEGLSPPDRSATEDTADARTLAAFFSGGSTDGGVGARGEPPLQEPMRGHCKVDKLC